MNLSSLRAVCVFPVVLSALSHSLYAQCRSGDPAGRFDGSATSSQAGELDVSLNLLCENGAYAGALNTPIGVFTVSSGSFAANTLKLELSANGNTIHLQAQPTGDALEGTFSTADDKGPLALHRVGDATPVNHPPRSRSPSGMRIWPFSRSSSLRYIQMHMPTRRSRNSIPPFANSTRSLTT